MENRLTIEKLYGEIVVLMTYCAMGNVEYLSSTECANRFENILETIKEYKDIEQELGIDLVKLLSAKKVYYMNWDRNDDGLEIKETYKLFVNLTDRTIEYFENEYSEFTFNLELKDYGKNDVYGGWAFTREELENV